MSGLLILTTPLERPGYLIRLVKGSEWCFMRIDDHEDEQITEETKGLARE